MEPGGLFAEYNENPLNGRRGELQTFDGSFTIPLPTSCHERAHSFNFKLCFLPNTYSVRLFNARGIPVELEDLEYGERYNNFRRIPKNLRYFMLYLTDELVTYIEHERELDPSEEAESSGDVYLDNDNTEIDSDTEDQDDQEDNEVIVIRLN